MDGKVSGGTVSPVVFAVATVADDREILNVMNSVPMRGAWRIGFSREPSYFACPAPAGIAENCLIARRDGRAISVGAWSVRDVWLHRAPVCAGYLHALRMAAGEAGSMQVLREGYRALAEHVSGHSVAGWFTSVDADNVRARRIFESRASGLPRYRRIAEYRTRVVPVRQRVSNDVVEGGDSIDELTDFLQREAARHELALTWNDARWKALAGSGFSHDDVVVVRRRGRIVAAAGVWDQRAWKQVVVHGFPAWLERIKPFADIAASCLGGPQLPGRGGVVPMAPVFPFAVSDGHSGVLPELWRGLHGIALRRGIDWLALGLDATDPLWTSVAMARIGIDYRTVLYQVSGKGFSESVDFRIHGNFRPECATL